MKLEMIDAKPEKKTRKFKDSDFYDLNKNGHYFLLPFRFHRITSEKEIIVNEVGDFLILPNGTYHRIVNRQINKVADYELYGDLISNYFITEEVIPPLIDVLATRYRTKKLFLNHFTGLHIFVISLRCEHTCHYCQVSRVTQNKDQYDMSLEYIDRGIDIMFKSPNPHLTMEFQGGEALLAFDNIKYAVEKAEQIAVETGKGLTKVICTNLAIVTEEILEYCKEHEILIST
jgi:sulfatase maturation enzyme AslB (radical SAM superfamily)